VNDVVHKYRYKYVFNKFNILINTKDVTYPLDNPSHDYFIKLKDEIHNIHRKNSESAKLLSSSIDLFFNNKLNESVYLLKQITHEENIPEIFDFSGFMLISFGKYEAAANLFRHALAIDPSRARSFFHLGLCCYYAGDYFGAIAHFTQAINLDTTTFEYPFINACALFNVDYVDLAIVGWQCAERIDDSYFGTQFNLASAYLKIGKNDAAELHLCRAKELNPDFVLSTV
jgi:tetratricopeptide (TPR) repeat protein